LFHFFLNEISNDKWFTQECLNEMTHVIFWLSQGPDFEFSFGYATTLKFLG